MWANVLRLLPIALLVTGVAVVGCAATGDAHESETDSETTSSVASELSADATVTDAVAQSCITTAVKGLATQLVDEIQCMRPGTMKRIDNVPGLKLGEAVFPYLQAPAADALTASQQVRKVPIEINSGLRTLPQQFLLYRWYKTGRCGIGLAAAPGNSNHESAIAVDIQDNAAWRSAMQGKGFRWLGASDPVHYDFTGKGTVDIRGLSVQAFQRLWNRNHPDDKIGEDGKYGDDTEKRLGKSPANGFAIGAKCDDAGTTTTVPTPPMTTIPDEPDADETAPAPKTSASKVSPSKDSADSDDDDDDDAPRDRLPAANAGCNVNGGGGTTGLFEALAALYVLTVITKGVRRRVR